MRSSFDYYKRIENPEMYLCNPDQRFLCALNGENRMLTLRFNDLSELSFTVPKIEGTEDSYNLIETKRLIYLDKIGWFQIGSVSETIEGEKYSKSVIAQSHQAMFSNRGFVTEERVYMFYNPLNPHDDPPSADNQYRGYDSSNPKHIPSILGQLYQQLGIDAELSNRDIEPTEDRKEWIIIYIDPILKFDARSADAMYESAASADNICRSFSAKNDGNGYDFMVNDVEEAFEVIFEFDFLYHTIKVKTIDNITKPTNIYLSFENVINTLEIKENAEDIVTVMSCEGNDLDIRTVNPMGTNYIVDFSYYKKLVDDNGLEYPWMSRQLIEALDEWEVEFEKWRVDDEERTGHTEGYSTLVGELQELYTVKSKLDADKQFAELKLMDMQLARDQYQEKKDAPLQGSGYVTAETIKDRTASVSADGATIFVRIDGGVMPYERTFSISYRLSDGVQELTTSVTVGSGSIVGKVDVAGEVDWVTFSDGSKQLHLYEKSKLPRSVFYNTPFSDTTIITGHVTHPQVVDLYVDLPSSVIQTIRESFEVPQEVAISTSGKVVADLPTSNVNNGDIFVTAADGENRKIYTGHLWLNNEWKEIDSNTLDAREFHYEFVYTDEGRIGTPKAFIDTYVDSQRIDDNATIPFYFMENDARSYCKLTVESEVGVVQDADGFISKNGTAEVRGVMFRVSSQNGIYNITLPNGTTITRTQSNSYFVYPETNGTRYRVLSGSDGIVTIYAFYISGFERYTTYTETRGNDGWCTLWENHINRVLTPAINALNEQIDEIAGDETKDVLGKMGYIKQQCDIQLFVQRKSHELYGNNKLYNELSDYWIEGGYTNNNLATYDSTTMAERIGLANELFDAAKKDLAKSAQPQFQMTVDAINFIKMIEFRRFTDELALGKVITIEKEDGVHYRPALMTLEYDLDQTENFVMTFSNASKPGETSMTFADLIKESTSASRTVTANWSNLMDYSRNKAAITSLIDDPLDRTLRAAKENMAAQAFIIDNTGILGRKYTDDSLTTFSPKQLRMMNNLLIFTDDNWATAKTALGEISLPNGSKSYGLIAETVVGNLILGDSLVAANNDGTVILTGDGIAIKNGSGEVVFEAMNNGNITVKNYASQTDLDALGMRVGSAETSIEANAQAITLKASQTDLDALGMRVGSAETSITQNANDITACARKEVGTTADEFSYKLDANGFYLYNGTSAPVFKCDSSGVEINGSGTFSGIVYASDGSFTGHVAATSGTIGAFEITQDGLQSVLISLTKDQLFLPTQAQLNLNNEVLIYDRASDPVTNVATSYIETRGAKNFEIKNGTGAGIRFLANTQAQTATVKLNISNPRTTTASVAIGGGQGVTAYSNTVTLYLDFSFTGSQNEATAIPTAYQVEFYTKHDNGQVSGNTTVYTKRTYTIPANVGSGTMQFTFYTYTSATGTSGVTMYPSHDTSSIISWSESSGYGSSLQKSIISIDNSNTALYSLGSFFPRDTNCLLGDGSHKWGLIAAESSLITTSDRRYKNTIEDISERYEAFFDLIKPVTYKFNNGSSDRTHTGFIAQDIEDSLLNVGLTTKEFAGICIDETSYSLRYEEFIALCVDQIQKLKVRVSELEAQLKELKEKKE